jgi:colanic acid/amylovoran biosynthesis glycosyltransferase
MTDSIRVGIHVNSYPLPSEAFVIEQARALSRFKPVMFVRRQNRSVDEIECHAIAAGVHGLRRKVFALKPGVWAWGGPQAFADIGLIHAHFGPNGVYALPLSKAMKIPLVVTFHGFDATVRASDHFWHGGVFGLRYLLGLPALKRRATRVIAVSQFIESRLLTMGFPESSIRQHYIGVDPARFIPIAAHARSLDIVCVGRLTAAKGIEELIRAFAKIAPCFPESRLRLIGEGAERRAYEDLVGILKINGRVVFEGTMAHERVAAIVSRCAVSVLASKTGANGWQEAFGLASIEAAAAGLPSIVSRNGGLTETVEDGVTGLVIGESNVDELADALSTLLSDESLRERLGTAGRQRVLKQFDLNKQTAKLEDIYLEALNA